MLDIWRHCFCIACHGFMEINNSVFGHEISKVSPEMKSDHGSAGRDIYMFMDVPSGRKFMEPTEGVYF